jgi:hypothetical protein
MVGQGSAGVHALVQPVLFNCGSNIARVNKKSQAMFVKNRLQIELENNLFSKMLIMD